MTTPLDVHIDEGPADSPVVVLIHGLGMNRHFWSEPALCPAVGGMVSLPRIMGTRPAPDSPGRVSLGLPPQVLPAFSKRLKETGMTVVSWSQKRPLGPVQEAVDELACVMDKVTEVFAKRPVHLVCHSRGGLIARKHLSLHGPGEVRSLVTMGTPHHGTRMASIGKQLGVAAPVLEGLLPRDARGTLTRALKRAAEFFSGPALSELMPESSFIHSLGTDVPSSVRTFTVGGTNPALLTLYIRAREHTAWTPIQLPGFLFNTVPERLRPLEVLDGKGDGLVTDESSRLPGVRHMSVPRNHVTVAFDPEVQKRALEFLLADQPS